MVGIYIELLEEALNQHTPFKRIKVRSKHVSGVPNETEILLKQRCKARNTGSTSYKNLRNKRGSGIKKNPVHRHHRLLKRIGTTIGKFGGNFNKKVTMEGLN